MKKNLYLIIILFSLVSCYTYQVKKTADPASDSKADARKNSNPTSTSSVQASGTPADPLLPNLQAAPVAVNIREKLSPNKNVKIDVDGKSYKVIVDRWESDSLVAHPVRNAKKTLKFHKNQINSEKIAEKRFSQPIADIITIVAYAGIGIAIWALVK